MTSSHLLFVVLVFPYLYTQLNTYGITDRWHIIIKKNNKMEIKNNSLSLSLLSTAPIRSCHSKSFPAVHSVFCDFLCCSHQLQVFFHCVHKRSLWSSSRPQAGQVHLQHHLLTYSLSLLTHPNHLNLPSLPLSLIQVYMYCPYDVINLDFVSHHYSKKTATFSFPPLTNLPSIFSLVVLFSYHTVWLASLQFCRFSLLFQRTFLLHQLSPSINSIQSALFS